ncbi:RNA polymerase sigma factor, partial [Caulobacter endophyticus]
AAAWPRDGAPRQPAAWLYATARRCALDALRKRAVRSRLAPDAPEPAPTVEQVLAADETLIPDERLRLIFVCCHPAVAAEARAALTLRLVCGLSTPEIARAFLVSEAAMFQRLTRAKRKIAQAGVPFEIPGPQAWPERLGAVLSTLEVAYAKAHEDAAGASAHAGYAREMLDLTAVLADLLPDEPECLGLAALVRFAEARRPARLDETGAMTPLSEQDPALWRRALIGEGEVLLRRAAALDRPGPRQLQAALHAVWSRRTSLAEPPRWGAVLALYDALLAWRDDEVVRLNRAVALAEVAGPQAAMAELDRLDATRLEAFGPFHALRADLLVRLSRPAEARAAYDRALALAPAPAERLWLQRRRTMLGQD